MAFLMTEAHRAWWPMSRDRSSLAGFGLTTVLYSKGALCSCQYPAASDTSSVPLEVLRASRIKASLSSLRRNRSGSHQIISHHGQAEQSCSQSAPGPARPLSIICAIILPSLERVSGLPTLRQRAFCQVSPSSAFQRELRVIMSV